MHALDVLYEPLSITDVLRHKNVDTFLDHYLGILNLSLLRRPGNVFM